MEHPALGLLQMHIDLGPDEQEHSKAHGMFSDVLVFVNVDGSHRFGGGGLQGILDITFGGGDEGNKSSQMTALCGYGNRMNSETIYFKILNINKNVPKKIS